MGKQKPNENRGNENTDFDEVIPVVDVLYEDCQSIIDTIEQIEGKIDTTIEGTEDNE